MTTFKDFSPHNMYVDGDLTRRQDRIVEKAIADALAGDERDMLELVEQYAEEYDLISSEDELYEKFLEHLATDTVSGEDYIKNDPVAARVEFANFTDSLHTEGLLHILQVNTYDYEDEPDPKPKPDFKGRSPVTKEDLEILSDTDCVAFKENLTLARQASGASDESYAMGCITATVNVFIRQGVRFNDLMALIARESVRGSAIGPFRLNCVPESWRADVEYHLQHSLLKGADDED